MLVPTNRKPTHPGEMLLKEFLNPMGITQLKLAGDLKVPYQRINEIVNEKRGITPSTALKLSKYFGTSPSFWMKLQIRYELYFAMKKEEKLLRSIKAVSV